MKIKALIVDDEKQARKMLTSLLTEFIDGVELLGAASSVKEAVEFINNEKPDVVFLDIQMPKENGFALFNYFNEFDFEVVFTTAYDEYALKAIKHGALDYLLKPIDPGELQKSVDKVIDNNKKEESVVHVLPESAQDFYKQTSKIILPIAKGFKVVKIEEILYCEASGSYTIFHLTNGKEIVVAKNLKYFEGKLSDFNLLRIHDSFMVNVSHIDSYIRGRGGVVVLNNGKEIEVSRSRKDTVIKWLS